MILAVDVGNTNIVLGCLDNDNVYFIERLSTDRIKTELEYSVLIKNTLELHNMDTSKIKGAIISSVVPQLTNTLDLAVEKILKIKPLILDSNSKTDLSIKTEQPEILGADLIADAVAGISLYKAPMIIIDMGTATTVSVIDKDKNYLGGLILPGVIISLDALTNRASRLGGISLDNPKHIIGKNTVDCMKSGIIYSNASMIDGVVSRINSEIGEKCTVICTGGLSKKIIPYCKEKVILDENLLLKGLLIIYNKNVTN